LGDLFFFKKQISQREIAALAAVFYKNCVTVLRSKIEVADVLRPLAVTVGGAKG
jgi:hypothetical protein